MTRARIIFVPGLNPKPPPEIYRLHLKRVLAAALRRMRPQAADWLDAHDAPPVTPEYAEQRPAHHASGGNGVWLSFDWDRERFAAVCAAKAEQLRRAVE